MRQSALARQSQIEAERSEGGAHGKTMGDDGGSIWQSRSKQFVSFLPSGLITVAILLSFSAHPHIGIARIHPVNRDRY